MASSCDDVDELLDDKMNVYYKFCASYFLVQEET
jgi:hypothetical protein